MKRFYKPVGVPNLPTNVPNLAVEVPNLSDLVPNLPVQVPICKRMTIILDHQNNFLVMLELWPPRWDSWIRHWWHVQLFVFLHIHGKYGLAYYSSYFPLLHCLTWEPKEGKSLKVPNIGKMQNLELFAQGIVWPLILLVLTCWIAEGGD